MKKVTALLMSLILFVLLFSPAFGAESEPPLLYEYGGRTETEKFNSYSFNGVNYLTDEVFSASSGYYALLYSNLNDDEKMVYDYIMNSGELGTETFIIDVSALNILAERYVEINFEEILYAINYDRPDYFWVGSMSWGCSYYDTDRSGSFSAGDRIAKIQVKTPYDKRVYPDIEGLYGDIMNEVKSIDFSDCENRYDFFLVLHDYLADKIYYTDENVRCYDVAGALIDEEAVCMGYSLAAKLVCNYYKIPCVVCASGTEYDEYGELIAGGHMWNIVQMEDGKWYELDITWDDQYIIMYDYFLCGIESVDTHFGHNIFKNSHKKLPDIPMADVPVSSTSYVYNESSLQTGFSGTPGCKESADFARTIFISVFDKRDYVCYNGLFRNTVRDGRIVVIESAGGFSETWNVIYLGDCDFNGVSDKDDYSYVVNCALSGLPVDTAERMCADLNTDGVIDVLDASLCEKAANGIYFSA